MATVTITRDSNDDYYGQGDGDSGPTALGANESTAPDLHFMGSGSWPIDAGSFSLCLAEDGNCTAQSTYDENDTVGVLGPGIENIIGYFKVKSSIR
ncbi:hypothetical protein [Paraliomyxa miuraensis]|uniref:hypothetical protein n=1 Tax=Paraliomyxa miuraensis TaxID=376150 RepID=UPI00224EF9A4|nr:hypothetical protein [Paraliomyxa miuraensis]MCX4246690.1 hypothetical protein [Paraliomyxa miuraensis]